MPGNALLLTAQLYSLTYDKDSCYLSISPCLVSAAVTISEKNLLTDTHTHTHAAVPGPCSCALNGNTRDFSVSVL